MRLHSLQISDSASCTEEGDSIEKKQLAVLLTRYMPTQPQGIERAITPISTQPVSLTSNLSSVDPRWILDGREAEPVKVNWDALTIFWQYIFKNDQVIGCSGIKVPLLLHSVVSQFTAAKLVYKLFG